MGFLPEWWERRDQQRGQRRRPQVGGELAEGDARRDDPFPSVHGRLFLGLFQRGQRVFDERGQVLMTVRNGQFVLVRD